MVAVQVVALKAIDDPTCDYPWGPWSFGFMRICLMVLIPLKCTWIPYLPQTCLILSEVPFVYGMTMCPIFFLLCPCSCSVVVLLV